MKLFVIRILQSPRTETETDFVHDLQELNVATKAFTQTREVSSSSYPQLIPLQSWKRRPDICKGQYPVGIPRHLSLCRAEGMHLLINIHASPFVSDHLFAIWGYLAM